MEAGDFTRAQALAAEAIALCERLGHPVAAAHIQLGLDLLKGEAPAGARLREERSPWGGSDQPELPEAGMPPAGED